MPLYEITLEQQLAGQQTINRWNYSAAAIPSGSLGALLLIQAMGFTVNDAIPAFDASTIAGQLQALQAVAVHWVQAVCKNLYDPTDYFAFAFPSGTTSSNGSSEAESPVIAVGFSTNRTRTDVRRGQKRFTGLTEGQVGDVGNLTSGALSSWQAIGDNMAIDAVGDTGADTVSFTPYVFGRKRTVALDGKVSYPYYPDEATQMSHSMKILSWTVKAQVRTQGTRQYGRGA